MMQKLTRTGKARLDANTFLDEDSSTNAEDNGKVDLKRVWAEGHYGTYRLMFGKFEAPDPDTITDLAFSGAEVSRTPEGNGFGWVLGAGRVSSPTTFGYGTGDTAYNADDTANYQYAGVSLKKDKLYGAVRFHHLNADLGTAQAQKTYAKSETDDANIWLAKGTYNGLGKQAVLTDFSSKQPVFLRKRIDRSGKDVYH